MGKLLPPHVNVFLRTYIAGLLHREVVRGADLMEQDMAWADCNA